MWERWLILGLLLSVVLAGVPVNVSDERQCPDGDITIVEKGLDSVNFSVPTEYKLAPYVEIINSNEDRVVVSVKEVPSRPVNPDAFNVLSPVKAEWGCPPPTVVTDDYSLVVTRESIVGSREPLRVSSALGGPTVIAKNESNLNTSWVAGHLSTQPKVLSSSDPQEKTVFVEMWGGSATFIDGFHWRRGAVSGIWVAEDINLSGDTVWYHEGVHSQQSTSLSPRMEWFAEASAEYLGALFLKNRHGVTRKASDQFDASSITNTPLENISESEGLEDSEYTQGPRLLLFVDKMLRSHSNKTFIDLFRWSEKQERLTYKKFRGYVVKNTNESVGRVIDRYMSTEEEIPLAMETVPTTRSIASAEKVETISLVVREGTTLYL